MGFNEVRLKVIKQYCSHTVKVGCLRLDKVMIYQWIAQDWDMPNVEMDLIQHGFLNGSINQGDLPVLQYLQTPTGLQSFMGPVHTVPGRNVSSDTAGRYGNGSCQTLAIVRQIE